jgi:nitronate monooxygenase
MTRDDLVLLLNELLEAERAGAKLLADWMAQAPPGSALQEGLKAVQRDEARNCALLIRHLRDLGGEPSNATGAFYDKALAIRNWRARLDFLNRGQGWVARRIAAALPQLPASATRAMLQEMHVSHVKNIAQCESLEL